VSPKIRKKNPAFAGISALDPLPPLSESVEDDMS